MKTSKHLLSLSVAIVCLAASAAIEIPKASGKALGVTRGKSFSEGVVFVDGRYLEPPYVVERWGVGIRINKMPVVGQVVDWNEFLKTQKGVKVVKPETEASGEAAAESESAPATESAEPEKTEPEKAESESPAPAVAASTEAPASLDDLFDDESDSEEESDSKAKNANEKKSVGKSAEEKKSDVKPVKKPAAKAKPVAASYVLEGEFVANDKTKEMLKKINKVRTEINAILLGGGFICFGENYARVSGDARTADEILKKLPDIQKSSNSESELMSGVRSAYLVYLTEPICRDLYRNRRDYLKLKARWEATSKDRAFNKLLNDVQEKPRY